MAVRPEYGPTLPALLRARGVSRRRMALGAAAIVLAVAAVVVAAKHLSHTRQLVVSGPLTFNFTYDRTLVHPVSPHPGELARLVGGGQRRSVIITARAVTLPPFTDDLVGGWLPAHADARLAQLRAAYPGLEELDEGKANTNDAEGYQIGFRVVYPGRRLFGRDVYALPGTPGSRRGMLLSLRQVLRGRATKADVQWLVSTRIIFRSFAYGTSAP